MKKIIYILFVFALCTGSTWAQSNWQFVGPKSTIDPVTKLQSADNKFETGQFNNITIDPYNAQHLFASSWFGGLWESTNRGATWNAVDINPMNCGGISAVHFLSSTEILVGDIYQNSRYGTNNDEFRFYSKAVWKYNFQTTDPLLKWKNLGLTNPSSTIPFRIKSVAAYPGSTSILFACTTRGLFRGMTDVNGNVTWTNIVNDCVENMVFVPNVASPGNYYCYITGSNGPGINEGNNLIPAGKVILKQSVNMNTSGTPAFTDLSSNFSSITNLKSHGRICVGPTVSNVAQFFINILGADNAGFGVSSMYVYTFKKNVNSNSVAYGYEHLSVNGSGSSSSEDRDFRQTIAYDNVNNAVWYGGIYLHYLYIPTKTVASGVLHYDHTTNGYIHSDMHDIQIKSYNSQLEMYVAHDGGIARTIIGSFSNNNNAPPGSPTTTPAANQLYFYPLNNKLDVCLLTGFSGTDKDANLYAIGAHDIVNHDVYNSVSGKSIYTREAWENDGAWIDKFNKNNMFFDVNQYHSNSKSYISIDGGQTITTPNSTGYFGGEKFYNPAAGNTFAQGTPCSGDGCEGGGFLSRQFYQDPYRPGRIFHGKSNKGISQYDPVSKSFVYKIEPWLIQPNLDWTCYTGAWQIQSWSLARGMSFSPQTPNSMHILFNGATPGPGCPKGLPNVVKYIGPNLDDCWNFHNLDVYTDGSGAHPQWANITPPWSAFGISTTDVDGINFIEVATSPWDKNVVYVMLNVPHHSDIFVLKYDGSSWSNYSDNLPSGELGYSMIMDHQSNDGIYLSTNMHIYYRDAFMDQWEIYKTGIPYVPASQIEVNYTDNTVRAGIYGRGIWKADLKCPDLNLRAFNNVGIAPNFFEANYITAANSLTTAHAATVFRAVNSITLSPNFIAEALPGGSFLGYIHGCTDPGNSFPVRNGSDEIQFTTTDEDQEEEEDDERVEENSMQAIPNPSNGLVTLTFPNGDVKNVVIYDMRGKVVFKNENLRGNSLQVNIADQPAGVYLIKTISGDKITSKKIIKQ